MPARSFIFAPMEERNDIVIYQSEDGLVKMEAMVDPVHETIWATQKAIAALFGKDVSDISRHIRNVYTRGELSEESTLQKMQIAFSDKPVQYYNLDMIISVGYRVNSIRATRFRIWATSIIKQYMLKGYVVNRSVVSEQKYEDLKRAMGLLENVFSKDLLLTSDQATDLFSVIRDYTYALDTLEEHNIYPKTNKLELTVPDLGSYINSADELTAEDIAFLKKHALDEAAKDLDVPVTFYAVYFCKIKDSAAHKYSGKGVVKVIYYYEQTFIISTTTVGKSYDYYDLCKDSKGNILFGETQTTGCSSSDTLVEDFDRNYSYQKIG